ncbi:MAG TPA: peptidase M4 family protein, partial [Pricia sp.]|nr:peptidase M4 family protein [Pricia sp.]
MCDQKYCYIVPPYILEELAKRGNTSCKKALNDTKRFRQKRQAALNNLLIRQYKEGDGDRFVYDSKNQYEQRVELVRQENDGPDPDETANQTYETSGFVRDYFKQNFDLNSIDGNGLDIISNIHYGEAYN